MPNVHHTYFRLVLLACVTVMSWAWCPGAAEAQSRTAWGASVVFSPQWTTQAPFDMALSSPDSFNVSGSEFRIGMTRGRITAGDWGVAFVSKRFDDGASVAFGDETCAGNPCLTPLTTLVSKDARVNGVEAYRYFNFVTIARRVQVGLELAGGAGAVDGKAVKTTLSYQPASPPGSYREVTTTEEVPATSFFAEAVNYVPLARVELGLGVIATESFKVRLTGGFNFPGIQTFSVRGIYLFGPR